MKKNLKQALVIILHVAIISFSASGQISNWVPVGPIKFPVDDIGQINGIGRVSKIKFDPVNPNRIYAVTPHSTFVSNDTATTWSVLPGTDALPVNSDCASICIDYTNNNVLYIGTGDADYYGTGSGVWKSTDGGATLTQSNTGMGNKLVLEILMSPLNHNTLVAATNAGIYKSTNAGATWALTSPVDKIGDMHVNKAANSTILYAISNSTQIFYSSTDFGSTWASNILDTLPSHGGRIALTAANTSIIYLGFVGTTTGPFNRGIIFKSNDGGATFTMQKRDTVPNLDGYNATSTGQGNYNWNIEADPTDTNTLISCAHVIWKSTDGGVTWVQKQSSWAGVLHTDEHQLIFNPNNNNQLFNSNDGGVWVNRDHGSTNTWTPRSDGLAASEFYHFANSHVTKYLIDCAAQDNGEIYDRANVWHCNRGGDFGNYLGFDLTNANKVYYYGSGAARRDLVNSPTTGPVNLDIGSTGAAQDRYAFSGQDGNVAFYANNNLTDTVYALRSTANLQTATPTWATVTGFTPTKQMLAIAVSPADANVLYVLSSDKTIVRSSNALSASPTFTIKTSAPKPAGNSSEGNFAIFSSGVVYMSSVGYVFRSADQGLTWSAVGSGPVTSVLNATTIHKLIVDTSHAGIEAIYAFTGHGIYYKDNTLIDWAYFNRNLPVVAYISDVDIYYNATSSNNTLLRASEYGRGVWETPTAYSIALPLTLLSFTVVSNPDNNVLLWKSEDEVNLKNFEIERSVNNSNSFQMIGIADATGAYATADYSFDDKNVQQNTDYFYRLKMMDNNGNFEYSNIVHVRNNGSSNVDIDVMPNPVTNGVARVKITYPTNESGEMAVIDMGGNIMQKQSLNLLAGTQYIDVNIQNLPKGTYIIKVLADNGILLVKQFQKR